MKFENPLFIFSFGVITGITTILIYLSLMKPTKRTFSLLNSSSMSKKPICVNFGDSITQYGHNTELNGFINH